MGKTLSKRKRQSDTKANGKDSRAGKSNLELYLEDVFQKECLNKAEKDEVEFIKTGVETLVQQIVDMFIDRFSAQEPLDESLCLIHEDSHKKEEKKTAIERLKGNLVEVYFPLRENSIFQKWKDVETVKTPIIKVGSFYEGTKNKIPNEFDFIIPLFCSRDKSFDDCNKLLDTFSLIWTVTKNQTFHHFSEDGLWELYLDSKHPVEPNGPASMLNFIYKDGLGEEKKIHADLVFAQKIKVDDKPGWFVRYVYECVEPKSFKIQVLSADSCLCVEKFVMSSEKKLSFTETEVYFIKNVLSRNHVKVYRILKFLLNGHGENKAIDYSLSVNQYKTYSSYMIKTMMIYHHDECRNSDTTDLGPCVLQVLEEMCKFRTTIEFPKFYKKVDFIEKYDLPGLQLQEPIQILKSKQTVQERYTYTENAMKSLRRSFFEHKIRRNHIVRRNARHFDYTMNYLNKH